MRYLLILLSIVFSLGSCVVIGLTSDYGKLDEKQRQLIVPLVSFNETKPGNIYKVNATQVKQDMSNYPKSMVYVFSVGCSSGKSAPISVFENFAKQNGYNLYLVLTGYSELNRVLEQKIESPLYSIDDKHYKTRYRHIYERYFTNELLNKPMKAKYNEREDSGNIYIYNYGQLVNLLHELPEGK